MKTNKALANAFSGEQEKDRDLTLSGTLPIDELLRVFDKELSQTVAYDSFEYSLPAEHIHIQRGKPQPNRCQYGLRAGRTPLGTIYLTRQLPFREEELLKIEKGLGALSAHLNNALETQREFNAQGLDTYMIEIDSRPSPLS